MDAQQTHFFALSIYVFAAFGLWYILGKSLITRAAREWAFDFDLVTGKVVRCDCGSVESSIDVSALGHLPDCPAKSAIYPLRIPTLLIECPACLGVWLGFVAFLFGINIIDTGFFLYNVIINALFTCGTNLFLAKALGLIETE